MEKEKPLSEKIVCLKHRQMYTEKCGDWVFRKKDVKEAVENYISEEWVLFMAFLDGEITFMELVDGRLKLEHKIFGEELSK